MKSTAIVYALAASLGFASLAHADDKDRRGRGNEQRFDQRGGNDRDGRHADRRDPRDNRHGYYNGGYQGPRGQNYGNARNDRFYPGARGPQFYRGGHIPSEYRDRQYHVNDWRGHRLSAPPRGQQWVQVGTDYALIAVATGLILNMALR
jgi:Ni/Co efflux regulator RcnB